MSKNNRGLTDTAVIVGGRCCRRVGGRRRLLLLDAELRGEGVEAEPLLGGGHVGTPVDD